jgi:DNA modification methylase
MTEPYYQDKWVTIYHGNCRDILPKLNIKVDLVLVDPLYQNTDDYIWLEESVECRNGLAFVNAKWLPQTIRKMNTILPILTYTNANGAGLNGHVITKAHHLIWWGTGKIKGHIPDSWLSSPWEAPYRNKHKWTKNPKYYLLMIANFTDVDECVLDPFMGTGITLYCSKKLNRYSVGIEQEEQYCEEAAKRCSQSVFELKETDNAELLQVMEFENGQ